MNRQIRLSTVEQIQKRLKEFTGRKINIVLRNRKVLFGIVKNLENDQLTFLNMRQEPVVLSLNDISEVYLDTRQ